MTEKLERLWRRGVPTREIAATLGVTGNAVIGKADRLGLPDHINYSKARWVRTRRRKLTRLWQMGVPVAEIGASLGCSRVRVSQIASDLGLPSRNPRNGDGSRGLSSASR